ncbi:MAG TPA: hypothetical protein VGQ40_02910, partial [Chthoniobacterales bacterium]|nr:hypothetical protein [Chthoniobacterales bacterium]
FVVIDGKPHLRIYLNQDEKHFVHGDDFIAPQQVFPPYDNSQHYVSQTPPGFLAEWRFLWRLMPPAKCSTPRLLLKHRLAAALGKQLWKGFTH